MKINQRKVLLVGDGAVGSSFAFSLLQNCQVDELVITDLKKDHVNGDVADLEDIIPLESNTKISAGEYSDAQDAAIVVITAGVPRKPGESRLDLVQKNYQILKAIVEPIVASGFQGCFVVSSNPVDILTTLTQKLSGFPKNKVIGTGTSLDTARLKVALAQKLNVAVNDINSYVLGEHGDSSFVNFEETTVLGRPLAELITLAETDKEELEQQVRSKGGYIIQNKGATFYGVARCLAQICQAILDNQNLVVPISAPLNGEYGLYDMYLGSPAIINNEGIAQVIATPLSQDELKKMKISATQLAAILEQI